jgi:hypothetical protein
MSSSRSRILSWFSALAVALLASVQGCDCGSTGADTRRFACNQDDECASGFVCLAGECQPEGGPVDEPDGGVDAGIPDGGGADAGTDGGPTPGTDGGTDGGPSNDGGIPGGPDAGTPDGGTPSKPTQLTFASPAQTVGAGQCSAATVVEARDANGIAAPVTANTALGLNAQPGSNFNFYSDAACTTSAPPLTMAAGSSRATFYFRSTATRSVRLTVSATGLASATQTVTIVAAAPTSMVFASAPQTLQAGACSARVDLETRDAYGNAATVPSQTSAALLAQASSGISFFMDAACSLPTPEAVFAAGTSRASFYFTGKTGGTFTLSATVTGLPTATQNATLLPVVRTGACTLPLSEGSVTCPISPPQLDMAKTMLLFQASSNDSSPDSSSLNCALTSVSSVTCTRNDFDDGDEPEMLILWQTAELPTGLKVQHLQGTCSGAPVTELPIQPVSSLRSTFLLVSSEQDGSTQGEDDFYTASITSADHVDLGFSVNCQSSWRPSIQVVEFQGTDVTRGMTGAMSGTQLVVSGLPAVDLGSTALLFTFRMTGGTTTLPMCDRILRGELTSPTSITFSRGDGAPGCTGTTIDAISWERIHFGDRARAQHFQVAMNASTSTVTVPITSVDPTRTLVFASGQAQSGQGSGETSYATDDIIGAALGWHTLTAPTTLRVTRGAALGTARWHSTVLQLVP